jgi:hypothetical protein
VTASPAVEPQARPPSIEPAVVVEAPPEPEPRPERPGLASRRALIGGLALAGLVVTTAALAVSLHRNGHSQGDDFALYLRQARSIFDGDIADVVADNRFSVLYSNGRFSPYAYPWGWPLLLSPFVHLWGLDYDRLKLVEVAAFCAWLVLVHGIMRSESPPSSPPRRCSSPTPTNCSRSIPRPPRSPCASGGGTGCGPATG